MKILGTLVEMKSEIASKQDHMLKVMADGQTRKRTRDEQDQGQQDSPDSRRQRVDWETRISKVYDLQELIAEIYCCYEVCLLS